MAATSKVEPQAEDKGGCEFNPLEAFEREQGLPQFIPRNLLEKQMFTIECAAGEPEAKQFKITTGLLLVAVPAFMNPPLEFGDYVLSVNDENVKDRAHFYQIIKDFASKQRQRIIKVSVERVISSVQVPKNDPSIPSEIMSSQRCDYFKNTMIFFPRSSLGINIKSVNKKVYVESTDNGFNSIARRAFFIGDALLAVNGTKCTSVKQASNLLVNALKAKGIARVLIERPVEPAAVAFVRAVLLVNKKNIMDPKMPDDVIVICKKELQRMRKESGAPAKKILKRTKASNEAPPTTSEIRQKEGTRVKIAETVTEVGIGMEMFNPALLEHVPGLDNRSKDV